MIDDGIVHVWRAPLDVERFSTGRGVLRHVLAQYTGSRPGELRLVVDAHGKPRVDGGVQFSFSRSADIAVVAVSAGRDVGVDVERIRGDLACDAIARSGYAAAVALGGEGAWVEFHDFVPVSTGRGSGF